MSSQWFCKISGEKIGPMSSKELRAMAEAGQLTPQHLVRRGNDGKWTPAIRVGGLFGSGSEDDSSDNSSHEQIVNVPAGNDSHRPSRGRGNDRAARQPQQRRAAGAQNRTPRSRRPIPTNAQRPAAEPSQPAGNSFGIVTDGASPATRVSGRSSRGGEGGKKNQNTTIIIAALAVLGVVAVGAIVYMATRPGDEVAVQSGTLPSAPPTGDPEGEGTMDLGGGGSGETDTDPAAEPAAAADPDEPAGGAEKPGDGANGRYTDASAGGHRIGDYEVKVLSAETGIPQFTNRPKDLEDEYFVVTIKVYNRHEGKRMPYKSWTGSGAKSMPKLVDDYDNPMKFQKGSSVEGRRVATIIDPDESVKEVLVFSKITGKQKYLLLNLPGSAVQATEDICFKIPTVMIGEAPAPEESSEPLDTRSRATKGAGDLVDEAAAAKDDPLRAAVAERLDDDGNPVEDEVEVINEPAPGPKTGDTLLDQLSEQHGF